jgi:hypothetical protein
METPGQVWWARQVLAATVMSLTGEWLCMKVELQAISIPALAGKAGGGRGSGASGGGGGGGGSSRGSGSNEGGGGHSSRGGGGGGQASQAFAVAGGALGLDSSEGGAQLGLQPAAGGLRGSEQVQGIRGGGAAGAAGGGGAHLGGGWFGRIQGALRTLQQRSRPFAPPSPAAACVWPVPPPSMDTVPHMLAALSTASRTTGVSVLTEVHACCLTLCIDNTLLEVSCLPLARAMQVGARARDAAGGGWGRWRLCGGARSLVIGA